MIKFGLVVLPSQICSMAGMPSVCGESPRRAR